MKNLNFRRARLILRYKRYLTKTSGMIDYGLDSFEHLENDEELKKVEEKVLIGFKIAVNAMQLINAALEKREEILNIKMTVGYTEAVNKIIPAGTLTPKDEAHVETELSQLEKPMR